MSPPRLPVVYRRDGCPYCLTLEAVLRLARVRYERHDIRRDEAARGFVRAANDGNETVPTVVLGDRVVTNPPPWAVVRWARGRVG